MSIGHLPSQLAYSSPDADCRLDFLSSSSSSRSSRGGRGGGPGAGPGPGLAQPWALGPGQARPVTKGGSAAQPRQTILLHSTRLENVRCSTISRVLYSGSSLADPRPDPPITLSSSKAGCLFPSLLEPPPPTPRGRSGRARSVSAGKGLAGLGPSLSIKPSLPAVGNKLNDTRSHVAVINVRFWTTSREHKTSHYE